MRQTEPQVHQRNQQPVREDQPPLRSGTCRPTSALAMPPAQRRLTGSLPTRSKLFEQLAEVCTGDPGQGRTGTGRTGPGKRHDSPNPCGPSRVTGRPRPQVLRLCRPYHRLGDDDPLTVESDSRAFVQFVAKSHRFAHTMAERGIVRAGQDSVDGQSVWWCTHAEEDLMRARPPSQAAGLPRANRSQSRWPPSTSGCDQHFRNAPRQDPVLRCQTPRPALAYRVHALAPHRSDRLAELPRVQPGERGFPGRLRRRDCISHHGITSFVTNSYRITLKLPP